MERQSKELEKERQRRLDIEQQRNILEGQKQIIEEANTTLRILCQIQTRCANLHLHLHLHK